MLRQNTLLLSVSTLLLVVSLLVNNFMGLNESVLANYILICVALLVGALMVLRGFYDYDAVKYSFGMGFLAIISLMYVFIVLLINAYGYLLSFTVALSPFLGIVVAGYFRDLLRRAKIARSLQSGGVIPFSRRFRNVLSQLDATMWFFMIFGFAYLTVFMIVPILLVLVNSFVPPTGGEWWSNFYNVLRTRSYVNLNPLDSSWYSIRVLPDGTRLLILRGANYGPIVNSILVASIVTVLATILGVVVAFVLARYKFPGHSLLRVMAIIPLFNTPFINAYVVRIIWGQDGPISNLLNTIYGYKLIIGDLVGVILAQTLTFFPIVYLNAYNSFINVDPSTEEQAENLGARGFKLFRSITLPLALPGIAAGSILVFVFSLEDLGAPIIFNFRDLISYRIYNNLRSGSATSIISPETAALGVVLLLLTILSFLAIRNYVSMRSYAMISRGGRFNPRIRRPGVLGLLAIYLLVFPIVVLAMIPQLGVILISLNIMKPYPTATGIELSMPGSLSGMFVYISKVLSDPNISYYITNTLIYAGVSVVIAVFLATAVGYSVSRLKIKWLANTLDALATSPLAIPGLVLAIGYFYFFTILANMLSSITPWANVLMPGPGFATWLLFIIAFSVRRLPYVVRSVFAGFQQVHENLEEAAMNLGASRIRVVFGVVLPFIIGYILSGALIGFIYMATEVSTSVTYGGINDRYAPLTYYMASTISGGAGQGPMLVAAMGTLLIIIQLTVVLIVVHVFKQRYAFIGV